MRFIYEVTTGISHTREPVVSKKVGRKVPNGRQALEFPYLPVVLSGLNTTVECCSTGSRPRLSSYVTL